MRLSVFLPMNKAHHLPLLRSLSLSASPFDRLLELAHSCDTSNLENLSGCECPTAREMLREEILTCATIAEKDSSPPACPKGCPVCEFCMVLEGCEAIYD